MSSKKDQLTSNDQQRLFWHNANGFRKSFEILMENALCGETINTSMNFLITPIVNGMLAIELYLKFLYSYKLDEIDVPHQHLVKTLFNNLPEKTQNELYEKFEEEGVSKSEVEKFFEEHSNDFVEWRYPSERMLKTDTTIIKSIIEGLFGYCDSIMRFYFDASKCIENIGGVALTI